MIATATMAQGVIDVRSHIITPEFVSSLESEGRLLDEGFPVASSSQGQMLVRLAEIEVYPQYLTAYLEAAKEIQIESLNTEPGVLCLFPTQMKEDSTQVRILEIYASQEAYQHHIQTAHFLKYKKGTLHMVKSLKLQDLSPLSSETISLIFKKAR